MQATGAADRPGTGPLPTGLGLGGQGPLLTSQPETAAPTRHPDRRFRNAPTRKRTGNAAAAGGRPVVLPSSNCAAPRPVRQARLDLRLAEPSSAP
jgi:hypothetical protein